MKKVKRNNRLEKTSRVNAKNLIHNHISQNEIKNQENDQYKLLNKYIEVIEEKKHYILVSEKSKLAKFIIENVMVMEIYNILKSNIKGY
ncbi:MAG: hypothetical protein ACFFAN_19710 [Promethearchaeota archaeon]